MNSGEAILYRDPGSVFPRSGRVSVVVQEESQVPRPAVILARHPHMRTTSPLTRLLRSVGVLGACGLHPKLDTNRSLPGVNRIRSFEGHQRSRPEGQRSRISLLTEMTCHPRLNAFCTSVCETRCTLCQISAGRQTVAITDAGRLGEDTGLVCSLDAVEPEG